jgi:hypothetical protein
MVYIIKNMILNHSKMLNYHPGDASQVDTVVEVLTGFNRKTPAIQENERYVHVFWNGSKSKP